MGSLSDYAENALLDHLLKTSAFTQPSVFVGLSTADPLDDGSGMAEPSGFSYARVEVEDWDEASGRATQNTDEIVFPEARGSWGTITHFALFDALTGGNMLAYGAFTASITIGNGGTFYVKAGLLDIIISAGGLSDAYANKVLDHLLGNTVLSVITSIYVGLATATVLDSDTGSTVTEPADGYARVVHNAWDAAASGASENTGEISFGNASGTWDEATDFFLADALSGGDIVTYGVLDTPVTLTTGNNPHWAAGAFDIELD